MARLESERKFAKDSAKSNSPTTSRNAHRLSGILHRRYPLVRGITLCLILATLASILAKAGENLGIAISGVSCALVLGIGYRVLRGVDSRLGVGISFMSKRMLKAAIILMGVKFGVSSVLAVGLDALGVIIIVITSALVTALLMGRLIGVDRRLSVLIGVGTAICGNSAIAAVSASVRAKGREVSFAVAVITFFGSIAMFLLPLLGHALDMSQNQFGMFAGVAVHDAAQAIGSGYLYGDTAGEQAAIVKLTRTLFLLPIVVALALAQGRFDHGKDATRPDLRRSFPFFALGFLVVACFRSLGDAVFGAANFWAETVSIVDTVANLALIAGMVAVGLLTKLGDLRELGVRPVLVGLVTALTVSSVALIAIVAMR